MTCWFNGIALSLVSSSASLVKLRADGRRFALSNDMARRETGSEKSSEERVRDEEERREKGRALLAYVAFSHLPRHVDGCGTRQRQTLLSQLVMDSCDIWIPATNLGYTKLNDGVLGFLGSVPFHIFGIFIGLRLESTLTIPVFLTQSDDLVHVPADAMAQTKRSGCQEDCLGGDGRGWRYTWIDVSGFVIRLGWINAWDRVVYQPQAPFGTADRGTNILDILPSN